MPGAPEHAETAEGEETRTYGYNGFGNLISVASTTPQATSEAAYTYSYDGKRISKYIDGTLYDYTYTGSNLLETYADTAGRIAKYTYGNALISQSNATGDTHSVITDYQNSVSASVSASGGALTLFAYTPFGKVRYQSNPDTTRTLGWLSRQYDSETGNHYLINRYYNADRGSFLSPDQYQYVNNATPFTWNLYQYAYANPLVNVDPEGLKILSGDPLFNVIDQYEPQLSLLDRAMTYYDLQQTYDYKGEGLFESYNPFLTRQAPVDANVRAYKTDSNGYYYVYKVMNLKEGQREPTLRYVPLNVGDSTVGKHFAFNSSFLEGLQWKGHVRSQAGRYQQNEHDWGNFSGKLTNVALNFAAVIDTALGLNKAAAVKLAQAERATAKVRLLNHLEESRLIRAARMRVASYAETDAPVAKIFQGGLGVPAWRIREIKAVYRAFRPYNVSDEKIREIINSFVPGTIKVRTTSEIEYGIRLYGENGKSRSLYLLDVPTYNRDLMAPWPGNTLHNIKQWAIPKGYTIIEGRVAPIDYTDIFLGKVPYPVRPGAKFMYPGGAIQKVVPTEGILMEP